MTTASLPHQGFFDQLRRRFIEPEAPADTEQHRKSNPSAGLWDQKPEKPRSDEPEIIRFDLEEEEEEEAVLFPKPETPPESFAVVVVGNKQYKVSAGDRIMVDHLVGTDLGDSIVLKKVLLVGSQHVTAIGRPLVQSCRVVADVEEQARTEKLIIFKKKRRKNYRRRNGFRSTVTVLRVTELTFSQSSEVAPTVLAYHQPQPVSDRLVEWDLEENRRRDLARAIGRKVSQERKRRRRGYE